MKNKQSSPAEFYGDQHGLRAFSPRPAALALRDIKLFLDRPFPPEAVEARRNQRRDAQFGISELRRMKLVPAPSDWDLPDAEFTERIKRMTEPEFEELQAEKRWGVHCWNEAWEAIITRHIHDGLRASNVMNPSDWIRQHVGEMPTSGMQVETIDHSEPSRPAHHPAELGADALFGSEGAYD